MKSLFGVETVFKTTSKHYKSAKNKFQKRVMLIPERYRDIFTQDVCVTPRALQIQDVKNVCILFQKVINALRNACTRTYL